MEQNFKQRYIQIAAMFLEEIIRSRKTSLARAAEISTRVVGSLSRIADEQHLLDMLKEVEKDFEEVTVLRQALHFDYKRADIRRYEKDITEYAAGLFRSDMALSARFLRDAASPGASIEKLCLRYPDFCSYISAGEETGRQRNFQSA